MSKPLNNRNQNTGDERTIRCCCNCCRRDSGVQILAVIWFLFGGFLFLIAVRNIALMPRGTIQMDSMRTLIPFFSVTFIFLSSIIAVIGVVSRHKRALRVWRRTMIFTTCALFLFSYFMLFHTLAPPMITCVYWGIPNFVLGIGGLVLSLWMTYWTKQIKEYTNSITRTKQ